MVLEKVKTIIADTLNCEESEITLTSNITEDFGADSLEMVELAMALEDAFASPLPRRICFAAYSRGYCRLHRKQIKNATGKVCRFIGGRPLFCRFSFEFQIF